MDAVILRASANALSAVRSLGRAGLEVILAAPPEDPSISWSRYVSRAVQLSDLDERAVSELMDLPAPRDHKPFLMPTGDEDVLLVAKHRDRLGERFRFVVPALPVMEAIIDKARLYDAARRNGIAHPRFHVVREQADIEAAVESIGAPCYVKPALSHLWRRMRRGKLEKAEDAAQLRRILQDFISLGLVAVPVEIIPGSDGEVHSLCAYVDRTGRPVAWRTKRKIRQYPLGAGDGCAQEITDESDVAELGLKLLSVIGHRGPATVEFRRDARDGRHVLMEVNARTILGQEMIAQSGLDAPLLAYCDAKGLPPPPPRPTRRARWVCLGPDMRAFREMQRSGTITTSAWLKSVARCNCFAYFAWDDPAPFVARITAWLARQLSGRIRQPKLSNL